MKIIGFAGYSGSGKTTLIEQLIPRFTGMGLRVSLIKHAHHTFEIDHPGKDSFRHRQAGAGEVMLVSSGRWALVRELRDEAEPSLEEQLSRMSPCDLMLVEGFKTSAIPKIEIYRPALGKPRLAETTLNIVALATDVGNDGDIDGDTAEATGRPRLDLNNHDQIAGFVLEHVGLDRWQATSRAPRFYVPNFGDRLSG